MRLGFLSAAILAMLASAATADVTLSVVDATPTARHDGTLPGIGETIFSADVFADVTPDDAWTTGALTSIGLGVGFAPGVMLYHTLDPNTGRPAMTAPGDETDSQAFSTFVSLPRGRTSPGRFGDQGRALVIAFQSHAPSLDASEVDLEYLEDPFPTGAESSGYTQRVTLDIRKSAFGGASVYVSADGPRSPGDVELARFESWALASDDTPTRLRWSFFAVPEPATGVLLCLACIVARRRV